MSNWEKILNVYGEALRKIQTGDVAKECVRYAPGIIYEQRILCKCASCTATKALDDAYDLLFG